MEKNDIYYLQAAIQLLKPDAEFSFENADYSTIKWIKLDGDAPSQSQVNAAIEQVKTNEAQSEADAAAKKSAAEAKLKALGLTADDLKSLGL